MTEWKRSFRNKIEWNRMEGPGMVQNMYESVHQVSDVDVDNRKDKQSSPYTWSVCDTKPLFGKLHCMVWTHFTAHIGQRGKKLTSKEEVRQDIEYTLHGWNRSHMFHHWGRLFMINLEVSMSSSSRIKSNYMIIEWGAVEASMLLPLPWIIQCKNDLKKH
jgi:hypothetical protein